MNLKPGTKWLITTDNWFTGPDGQSYKAVWGTVKGVFNDEQTLGIKTNARSSNWFVGIGNMVIAGCQIHYAIQCDEISLNPPIAELEVNGDIKVSSYSLPRTYVAD